MSSMIRMSWLPKLLEQEKYPSDAQPAQPPLRRARVRLEAFRAAEPDCVFDERHGRGAVVDAEPRPHAQECVDRETDRKSTRLNSSHSQISYAVFCLKKKKKKTSRRQHPLPIRIRLRRSVRA